MRDVLHRDEEIEVPTGTLGDPQEKRGAPRYALLIRSAKLITPVGEFLCVVRDASDSGVNLRLFHPIPEVGEVLLEMQNGDRHALELVWQDGERAGLRFCGEADIARILESPSEYCKRPIRVNVELEGEIIAGLRKYAVTICDLSQQGAKLSCEAHLAIDQRVKLHAPGMPEVNAKVRWRRDGHCGLVFEDTFQFGDLARILASLQLNDQETP